MAGTTIRKNTGPRIWQVARQPICKMSSWVNGVNIPWPMGLPVSASPSARPLLLGNQGARLAVAVNDETAFSPMVMTTP